MLYWSKRRRAPSPDFASAARTRPTRYSCRRRKSTRSSKSTWVWPGAWMGRSHRCFGSVVSDFHVGSFFDGVAASLRAMSASCERDGRRVSPITDLLFAIDSDAMKKPSLPVTPAQDAMPTTRGLNFYLEDRNFQLLCESVMGAEAFTRAVPHLTALGEIAGDELDDLAAVADRNPPTLRAWDEQGRRVDEVVRHPAYLRMEEIAFGRFGLAAMAHRPGVLGWPGRVPQVVKYALSYLFAQSEFGLLCSVNMTDSCARMLGAFGSEELKARYLPHLTATDPAALWQGTQWMTERTGGSEGGACTPVARRGADGEWRLWGDKWFTSVANAEVALTLARPEGAPEGTRGLGMFLVPKRLPDGSKNAWTINRLKDKLGSRSMATGEVTYAGAIAYVVGDLGSGFKQMMEMVNGSRVVQRPSPRAA